MSTLMLVGLGVVCAALVAAVVWLVVHKKLGVAVSDLKADVAKVAAEIKAEIAKLK